MIPDAYAARMRRIHGGEGEAWIASLPTLLSELEVEWNVEIHPPFPNLTYNYVAPAGDDLVVKLIVGPSEGDREPIAMEAYAGHGAARPRVYDPTRRAMLLERIRPGTDLREIPEPMAAEIAASVLTKLWQAKPLPGLAELDEWTAALDRFSFDPGPLPRDLIELANGLRRELLQNPPERVVIHGDLHHTNLLFSEDKGWLAIDPKGLVGEKAFDILFYLLNPKSVPIETTRLRIDTFVDHLNLDRERIVGWSLVQSVVSACWTVEDRETGWEKAIHFAEVMRSLMS